MSERCCICSQIRRDGEADLLASVLETAPGADEYFLREWDEFVLFPSIGALVPGHVLLCPRLHARSFAALPESQNVALSTAKGAVRRLLAGVFDVPVHAFEHGNGDAGSRVVCTVDHAHLHFMPAAVDISEELATYVWTTVDGPLWDITRGQEYLYYESPDGERWITVSDGTPFPSQYLRCVFARALGLGEVWNWREYAFPGVVRETINAVS